MGVVGPPLCLSAQNDATMKPWSFGVCMTVKLNSCFIKRRGFGRGEKLPMSNDKERRKGLF